MIATKAIGIVSAVALLAVILVSAQNVSASLGPGLIKKIQKPELYLYLSSPDGKVKHAKVTVNIQDVDETKRVTVSGHGYTLVKFEFPPLYRSWVDWFNAEVENPNTGEVNSYVYPWWDRTGPSYGYLTVYNTD